MSTQTATETPAWPHRSRVSAVVDRGHVWVACECEGKAFWLCRLCNAVTYALPVPVRAGCGCLMCRACERA